MQGLKPGPLTTGSKDPWLARAEAHFGQKRGKSGATNWKVEEKNWAPGYDD